MKYKYIFIQVIFLLESIGVFAQKYMIINQNNQQTLYPVDKVDSVTFVDYDEKNKDFIDGPLNPQIVSKFETSSKLGYEDFCVDKNNLYAVGEFGLRIFDLKHDCKLVAEKFFENQNLKVRSISQRGDYLYLVLRQKSSGKNELIIPEERIQFETNISHFVSDNDSISNNSVFNRFFKSLKIRSFNASTINKVYIYPARLENKIYRNIIRINYLGGSMVFVSKNYATEQEALANLKSHYETANGDLCDVDWSQIASQGVILDKITVYTTDGTNKSISNIDVINRCFTRLKVISTKPELLNKAYIYKAKLENGVYRNIIRFQGDNGSVQFVRNNYATKEEAIAALKDTYLTDSKDECSVKWEEIPDGTALCITNIHLNNLGQFERYESHNGAVISETGLGAPNVGNYSAKLNSSKVGFSFAKLFYKLQKDYSKGEMSFWLKNEKSFKKNVRLPILSIDNKSVLSLSLMSINDKYTLGLNASDLDISAGCNLNNGEWYNFKVILDSCNLSLSYRTKESAKWQSLFSTKVSNIAFNQLMVGIEANEPNVEIYVDNICFDANSIDETTGVNGKLIVVNKNSLNIENEFNLDLKGTSSLVRGNLLLVNCLRGYNIYNIENPINPRLISWHRPQEYTEFQNCAYFENEGKKYVVICNYNLGFTIVDVTEENNPKVVLEDLNNDLKYGGVSLSKISYNFDVVADYPYLYFTASTMRPYLNTNSDVRGITVMNISDFNNITKRLIAVPKEDLTENSNGDTRPTRIVKKGNRLIVNNTDKGVLVFDVQNKENPKYVGRIDIPGTNSINAIFKLTNGDIVFGDDASAGNEKNMVIYKGF